MSKDDGPHPPEEEGDSLSCDQGHPGEFVLSDRPPPSRTPGPPLEAPSTKVSLSTWSEILTPPVMT